MREIETVVKAIPIRECEARGGIARSLNFRSVEEYQKAVRHLLATNTEALDFARGLFEDLHARLEE